MLAVRRAARGRQSLLALWVRAFAAGRAVFHDGELALVDRHQQRKAGDDRRQAPMARNAGRHRGGARRPARLDRAQPQKIWPVSTRRGAETSPIAPSPRCSRAQPADCLRQSQGRAARASNENVRHAAAGRSRSPVLLPTALVLPDNYDAGRAALYGSPSPMAPGAESE